MLSMLQPVAAGTMAPLNAAEMTSKVLERQVQARYAAVAHSGNASSPTGDVSLASMVESALAADPAYGLLTAMTAQDASDAYSATAKLLTLAYENATKEIPTVEQDV